MAFTINEKLIFIFFCLFVKIYEYNKVCKGLNKKFGKNKIIMNINLDFLYELNSSQRQMLF